MCQRLMNVQISSGFSKYPRANRHLTGQMGPKPSSDQTAVRMTNSDRSGKHNRVWQALCIGAPLYLYLNLFSIRGIPYLLGGDQIFF